MVSGPEALLLSRGSTSLPQPRTPRTKMSGKSGGSFGNREEISGWMVSPQPSQSDSSVWAAWYLCSGNGTRQASFLSLLLSRNRGRMQPPPPHVLTCSSSWHLALATLPRSGACWPAPWGDPHQGGPQCWVCLQNLLGWAQVVS